MTSFYFDPYRVRQGIDVMLKKNPYSLSLHFKALFFNGPGSMMGLEKYCSKENKEEYARNYKYLLQAYTKLAQILMRRKNYTNEERKRQLNNLLQNGSENADQNCLNGFNEIVRSWIQQRRKKQKTSLTDVNLEYSNLLGFIQGMKPVELPEIDNLSKIFHNWSRLLHNNYHVYFPIPLHAQKSLHLIDRKQNGENNNEKLVIHTRVFIFANGTVVYFTHANVPKNKKIQEIAIRRLRQTHKEYFEEIRHSIIKFLFHKNISEKDLGNAFRSNKRMIRIVIWNDEKTMTNAPVIIVPRNQGTKEFIVQYPFKTEGKVNTKKDLPLDDSVLGFEIVLSHLIILPFVSEGCSFPRFTDLRPGEHIYFIWRFWQLIDFSKELLEGKSFIPKFPSPYISFTSQYCKKILYNKSSILKNKGIKKSLTTIPTEIWLYSLPKEDIINYIRPIQQFNHKEKDKNWLREQEIIQVIEAEITKKRKVENVKSNELTKLEAFIYASVFHHLLTMFFHVTPVQIVIRDKTEVYRREFSRMFPEKNISNHFILENSKPVLTPNKFYMTCYKFFQEIWTTKTKKELPSINHRDFNPNNNKNLLLIASSLVSKNNKEGFFRDEGSEELIFVKKEKKKMKEYYWFSLNAEHPYIKHIINDIIQTLFLD